MTERRRGAPGGRPTRLRIAVWVVVGVIAAVLIAIGGIGIGVRGL